MNHPDFRVCGKIFATLGYPDAKWGMLKLMPDQQEVFIADEPNVFAPAAGAWGREGSTSVRLIAAKKETFASRNPRCMAQRRLEAGRPDDSNGNMLLIINIFPKLRLRQRQLATQPEG